VMGKLEENVFIKSQEQELQDFTQQLQKLERLFEL
jgi:hypothetical protein